MLTVVLVTVGADSREGEMERKALLSAGKSTLVLWGC